MSQRPHTEPRLRLIADLIPGCHVSPEFLAGDAHGPRYIRTADVKDGIRIEKPPVFFDGDEHGECQFVTPEDAIICTDGFARPDKGDYGTLGVSKSGLSGILGPHLWIARSRSAGVLNRYLQYALQSDNVRASITRSARGATVYNGTSGFRNARIPIHTLPTQQAIADYLDRETARVDALIEKKTRLIELLEEKRQALITQAVTKGLDPDVPMKDSGVEWIGQVPAHWSVVKLKRIAKLRSGESIPTDEVSDDGRYPVYGSGGRRGYTSKFTNTESAVVVGRQGSCGKVTYAEGPFWASEHAVVVYPKMAAPMMWLGENLRTARLERYSNSAAQPGFGVADVVEEFFPLPTEHERWAIDQHIRERSSTITSLKNKTIQSVELLRERRSALITAAVTGQLEIGEDA